MTQIMTAQEAAKHTIASIRERNSLLDLEALIRDAANDERHTLSLTLEQVSSMFGQLPPCDVNLPATHPIPLRLARAELVRAGYDVNFSQGGKGWHLVISWKSSLSF